MNFETMTIEQLEERRAAILVEMDVEGADLDALETEARGIKEELEKRKAEEAKKVELRKIVAAGAGDTIVKIEPEERKVKDVKEIRNSKEYIDAYAEYIKTGDDSECRALLTENATNGTIPVPEFVYEIVKTAWDRNGITSRVRKAYFNGNLKVGFEISGSDAVDHPEGHEESEEALVLGTVEIVPATIMKWVSISKEAKKMRGEAFLRYIYDELTYKIAKKAADNMIAAIEACGTVSTTTCPGVPKFASTQASVGLVAAAIGYLSDEASNPVVMMNKLSWSKFKAAQYANGYSVDPFEGLPVEFSDKIKSIDVATTGETWLIVGDLDQGGLMLLPEDDEIDVTEDPFTLATSGLIRYVGDMLVGEKVVAPKAFVKVTK